MIALTGTSSGVSPDWPTLLADARRDAYVLPHLVLAGPSFPGPLGVAVARAGRSGQLDALLTGRALEAHADPLLGPNPVTEDLVDRYLARRAEARALSPRSPVEARLTQDLHASMTKLGRLKDLRYTAHFATGQDLEAQARVAVEALSGGVSRCVTLGHAGPNLQGWDTHANNDPQQSELWQDLFEGLAVLMEHLAFTPGTVAPSLAEETTVVVLSEMGRTPKLNPAAGKDHWPYTSMLLVGDAITGGRVVGGFDARYYGELVDPGSADTTDAGQALSAEAIGATLLALADIDPGPHVSGVQPLTGVFA